jgi:HAD superfamily hydrolase (TIGR01490 family)
MALALFDFDGTITFKDSFGDFIAYAVGRRKFITGTILLSPMILAYVVGLIRNWRAKELMSTHFFGGWDARSFTMLASKYSRERIPHIVREIALERIGWHKLRGDTVVVVSASIDLWLTDWCADCAVDLIATRLEIRDGRITGRFFTNNCSGKEKVRRIEERYDVKSFDYIYAYGDSQGDKAMLEMADERYYRWKRV